MKNLKQLHFLLLIIVSSIMYSKNYYVATNGNDNNPGTSGQPWKTIQKAARTVKSGDIVFVRPGTYSGTVNIVSSGVTFDGGNRKAILNGQFRALKKSNLTIKGFKIQGGQNGIYVEGPCTNIRIENNHTFDTFSSGIGVWGVGWQNGQGNPYYGAAKNVKILNNKVERACDGGYNECITLSFGVEDFLIKGNEILNGGDPINGGEGIDVKALCRNGRIENNSLHHLTRRGIYIDGGRPCSNIVVTSNESYNNVGQGLAIMCEDPGSVNNVTIQNNNFYNNTEDGIMFFKHPKGEGSKVFDVVVKNNTIRNNKRYGILLADEGATNIQICDNTLSGNTKGNFKVSQGQWVDCADSGNPIVTIRKGNATNVALDGNNGAANGQNVRLYSYNPNTTNQRWEEIDRGNGFYSYRKINTNFFLDAGNGGGNRQNVYLWTRGDFNQNQHFRKISLGNNKFRLEKRNSPQYSIDGNNGGQNNQNVYLWRSDNSNGNQHWIITEVGRINKLSSEESASLTNDINIFPNPIAQGEDFNVSGLTEGNFTMSIKTIQGKSIQYNEINNSENRITTSKLIPGIYIISIRNNKISKSKILVIK